MEEKVKNLTTLVNAFESRNELLNEEIKKNEQAISDMKDELLALLESDDTKVAECN